MSPSYDDLYALVQKQSDHVMELVKKTERMAAKMEALESSHVMLTDRVDTVHRKLPDKMTPDRCAHMHLELEQRIYATMKKGAKGWLYTVLVVLKIAALLSATFAAMGFGASSVGLLN